MDMYANHEGEETLERGEAPLLPILPLPLLREGGQGDRLPNNLKINGKKALRKKCYGIIKTKLKALANN